MRKVKFTGLKYSPNLSALKVLLCPANNVFGREDVKGHKREGEQWIDFLVLPPIC